MCRPKIIGGLGLRSMKDLNLALIAKLGWRFLNEKDGLWSKVLLSKYVRPSSTTVVACSNVWAGVIQGISKVVATGW